MAFEVHFDLDKCNGCGECVEICPQGVIEVEGDKVKWANPDECIGCESCLEVCEPGAITEVVEV